MNRNSPAPTVIVSMRDRRRSIIARGLLRRMLGAATGRPPQSLRFQVNPHGKPILETAPGLETARGLAFNVSHSGDYVMAAVGEAQFIGVDIEQHSRDIDLLALGWRVFTDREQSAIATAPDPTARFFRQWVFKEAVVKALGVGLSLDLKGFEIGFDGERAQVASPWRGRFAGRVGLDLASRRDGAGLLRGPGASRLVAC